MIARTSEQTTPLSRDVRFDCGNTACGARFAAQIEILRTVTPSLTPNPDVRLPFSNPNATRGRRPANDNVPRPANDDAPAVADARSG